MAVHIVIGKGKDITGNIYGDYKATKVIGKDSSGHNVWSCSCTECSHIINGTVYDLVHKRISTECPNCKKKRENRVKLTEIKINTESDNNVIKRTNLTEKFIQERIIPRKDSEYVTSASTSMNIINARFFFNIVLCLPGDLKLKNHSTANYINSLINFKSEIINEMGYNLFSPHIDKAIKVGNIISIFPVKSMNITPSTDDLYHCLEKVAEICFYNDIKYVAFPPICRDDNREEVNGFEWVDVKSLIRKAFCKVYQQENDEIILQDNFDDSNVKKIFIVYYEDN